MHYVLIAGLSALLHVIVDLLYKFTSCVNIDVDHFVCIWWIFGGLIALLYFFSKKFYTVQLDYTILSIIMFATLLTFTGNLTYFQSMKKVSNPGFSRAIYATISICLVTIISAIFFKKYISPIQIFALTLILIAIFLLANFSE